MPDWRHEYLVNLHEAEKRNPLNRELVDTCSQLADRVAALEAEKAVLQANQTTLTSPSTGGKTISEKAAASSDTTVVQLRHDLTEALRSKGQLQSRLKTAEMELKKLRTKSRVDDKRISDLTVERNALMLKSKDRNEELAGKNKMLKDLQDENLTLNIEIDSMDRKIAKLKEDNKDLLNRWMDRKGREADAMNLANESNFMNGK